MRGIITERETAYRVHKLTSQYVGDTSFGKDPLKRKSYLCPFTFQIVIPD
jgi:hypothetical protein